MKKCLPALLACLSLSLTSTPALAWGGGIIVSDPQGEENWITQTLKQAQQYSTQLSQYAEQIEQYKNQVQNTLAPAAYLWDQAQLGINQIRGLSDTLKNYGAYGGWENYLNQFRDSSYYSRSPCYSLVAVTGCSNSFFSQQDQASNVRMQTNRGLAQVLKYQQDALQQDSNSLEQIQSQVSSADGQMKAIQGGNQMLGNIANQLLQMRSTAIARDQAEAAARQAEADRDARDAAWLKQAYHHGNDQVPTREFQ